MIPITKPYLPKREKIDSYIDSVFATNWLTNNGPLVQLLTQRLAAYLQIDPECLVLVANGSLALQLAYRALNLKGDVLTTPFTFIATSSTLRWEGLRPIYVDIEPDTWNIDTALIEQNITPQTSAIVPVHVFGNPCEVKTVQALADKFGIKTIYDAAHCFGVTIDSQPIFEFGDVSTISLHATKLFHAVEGGAVVTKSKEVAAKVRRMINFGMAEDGSILAVGTNAKMSEFHAAVGLAVLDDIDELIRMRKAAWECYETRLTPYFELQNRLQGSSNNYSYFPVLLSIGQDTADVVKFLLDNGVQARRYFYPSLGAVDCLNGIGFTPVSSEISKRILCLPIWPGISQEQVERISQLVIRSKRL